MDRYLLSNAAKRDLRNISKYTIEQWGHDDARKYILSIHSEIESLLLFPYKGIPRYAIYKKIRSVPVGKHLIFYTIETNVIRVYRIIHQSMDISSEILNPEDLL